MDNAQKAIMIGVGLFITIIIISVVLLITNLGTGMVDDARDNLGNMSVSLQNTLKSSYDRKIVTGADVQSLYTQYKDNTDFVLVIEVKEMVGEETPILKSQYYSSKIVNITSGTDYAKYNGTAASATGQLTATNIWTGGFAGKINSSNTYKTYLIKDGDSILGVYCDIQ